MDKTLIVTVSPDGSTMKVEVDGVVGPGCETFTRAFEELGAVTQKEKKAEFFLEDTIPVEVAQ